MDRYPPTADHGLVGDLQPAALVSSPGAVFTVRAPGGSPPERLTRDAVQTQVAEATRFWHIRPRHSPCRGRRWDSRVTWTGDGSLSVRARFDEICPNGEQPGSFPQPFTHPALILAARALAEAPGAEQGR